VGKVLHSVGEVPDFDGDRAAQAERAAQVALATRAAEGRVEQATPARGPRLTRAQLEAENKRLDRMVTQVITKTTGKRKRGSTRGAASVDRSKETVDARAETVAAFAFYVHQEDVISSYAAIATAERMGIGTPVSEEQLRTVQIHAKNSARVRQSVHLDAGVGKPWKQQRRDEKEAWTAQHPWVQLPRTVNEDGSLHSLVMPEGKEGDSVYVEREQSVQLQCDKWLTDEVRDDPRNHKMRDRVDIRVVKYRC
jgi:hypothetical protein